MNIVEMGPWIALGLVAVLLLGLVIFLVTRETEAGSTKRFVQTISSAMIAVFLAVMIVTGIDYIKRIEVWSAELPIHWQNRYVIERQGDRWEVFGSASNRAYFVGGEYLLPPRRTIIVPDQFSCWISREGRFTEVLTFPNGSIETLRSGVTYPGYGVGVRFKVTDSAKLVRWALWEGQIEGEFSGFDMLKEKVICDRVERIVGAMLEKLKTPEELKNFPVDACSLITNDLDILWPSHSSHSVVCVH